MLTPCYAVQFAPLEQAIGLNAGINKKVNNFTGVMTAEMYRRHMGLGDIPLDSDEEFEDEQAGEAPTASIEAMRLGTGTRVNRLL